ncbi:unnamed protein product, partial [marine sediment metagenome]
MRQYSETLTAATNSRGVLDIDTVKGCYFGMKTYPDGGCYKLCYAAKIAARYKIDFSKSIIRKDINHSRIEKAVIRHKLPWFRVGTMGDPSYSWNYTIKVCEWLSRFKTPVIITKHWVPMSNDHISALKKCGAIVNTSTSPLDSRAEIDYRVNTFKSLKKLGVKSVLRVVSVKFGADSKYDEKKHIQDRLFLNTPIIDNPLRIMINDNRVVSGQIVVQKHKGAVGGSTVSISNKATYLGKCGLCPDQCGVEFNKLWVGGYKMTKGEDDSKMVPCKYDPKAMNQIEMFTDT